MFRPKTTETHDRPGVVSLGVRRMSLWLFVLWLAVGPCGCARPPQFPAEDQTLLEGLRTAISAKKPEWVAANAKRIDELHQQSKLSEEQYQALQQVIDATKADDWKSANQQIIRLEKAQRP
jgi:hypothetical protein